MPRTMSTQKLPMNGVPGTRETANECDHNRETHCCGSEVLYEQARNRREVAHGVLAAIRLPVRVGEEAHRGVERQVRGNCPDVRGVEREVLLQTHDPVEHDARHQAEGDEAHGVARPALLALGVHSQEPVHDPFDGEEDSVSRSAAIGLRAVHLSDVAAERWHADRQHGEKREELQQCGRRH